MLSFWKKCRARKLRGSFLIEVLAAVLVLSVGLLTVMQSFGVQRLAASRNQSKTVEVFMLSDHLGAALAGVDAPGFYRADRAEGGEVKMSSKALLDEMKGIREISLSFVPLGKSAVSGGEVMTYIKDEKDAF